MIKDFNKRPECKKIVKIEYKKICTYFFEMRFIFLVIVSALLATELYHLLNYKSPFDLIFQIWQYSLGGFAAYCFIIIFTLVVLAIQYDSEDANMFKSVAFVFASLSKIIGSKIFVYCISCLVVFIDAYFINIYIFHYAEHTILGLMAYLLVLVMINLYIIGYAIQTALCGLLIMAYDTLLTQRDVGYIPKLKE